MHRLNIKPLSLNSAYTGRRFATQTLKDFKDEIMYLLPKISVPSGKLALWCEFGVSSKNSDGDNLIKVFQDSLSVAYGFNDKQIYEWKVKKVDVPKGKEYISFNLVKYV